jgi:periplasmic divalent cation tolerance protein
MNTKFIIIYCTVPDQQTAETISENLVKEKLAACCNIVSGLKSVYRWEKKIQSADELLLIIKSRSSLYSEIETRIKDLHPYTVPEIIALPLINGSVEYLNWMDENVRS